MSDYNFKIKVKENIGDYSEGVFGKIGTIHNVINGKFTSGFHEWSNDGKLYKNVESLHNHLLNQKDHYMTLFELVEDCEQEEYNLTIQDIINEKDFKQLYKSSNGLVYKINFGELIYKGFDGKWKSNINTLKQILNMKFKKLEPVKKYIDPMEAVKLISEGKEVWWKSNSGNLVLFNNPNTNNVKIDMLLSGKWFVKEVND